MIEGLEPFGFVIVLLDIDQVHLTGFAEVVGRTDCIKEYGSRTIRRRSVQHQPSGTENNVLTTNRQGQRHIKGIAELNIHMVKNGFKILMKDPDVKAVFINIFGGILRCDTLANGVVQAAKEVEIKVPVVIRLEGTNVELGRRILSDSGLEFLVAKDMLEASNKLMELVGRG